MIEGGVSALQDLSRYMPDIAKAATASRDSAQSWAQAALATRDKLNIALTTSVLRKICCTAWQKRRRLRCRANPVD